MIMPKNRVHIHIGVHKNATTHLQQVLHANRKLIEGNHKLLYLPVDLRPKLGEHLYAIAMNEDADVHRVGLQSLFGLDSADSEARLRIVFDENICGRIRPLAPKVYPMLSPRLAALLSVFEGHDVKIFVCLRSYAEFYRSSYMEYIRSANHLTFSEFIAGFDYLSFGWKDLIEDLLQLVTPKQLVLYRYDEYREVMPKVIEGLCEVESAKVDMQLGERIYESLSNKAIDIVENSMHILTREERVEALRALQVVFPKKPNQDPKSFFTEEHEARLVEKFNADYRDLQSRFAESTFIQG